jgi:hypothetical protein
MRDRSQEYRKLAAESLRLAATTDDANSHTQYVALARMWTDLADEAEKGRATFNQAHDTFNNAPSAQQQEQEQPKEPEADKP